MCGRHFLVLKHLPRTRNGLCTPKRPRANLVQPTGWGFQAEIGLEGDLKKSFFFWRGTTGLARECVLMGVAWADMCPHHHFNGLTYWPMGHADA